jgi:CubicO group peptidase (beta-lactamase class C family)
VTLVWKDTVVFKKETGAFSSKNDAPIALSSQWLTTALILVLVDEGKLSLDDKVSDYLPIFSTYGKNYITIRHCLSHFTGIEAGTKLVESKFESLETEAAAFAKKEIQTNPGTEFRYSSAGMMLAGRVAEVVMKRKFDQLIKQKLFNPLGMTKTSFSTMDGSGVNPATGAKSTPNDMLRFLQMLLNNGKLNGRQVLSEASVKEMRRIQAQAVDVKFAPKAATGLSYAMGSWALQSKDGEATVLTSPGIYGVWPVVDWCRGYAMIIMSKEFLPEQKAETFNLMKGAVEDVNKNGNCNE